MGDSALVVVCDAIGTDEEARRIARRMTESTGIVCRIGITLSGAQVDPELVVARALEHLSPARSAQHRRTGRRLTVGYSGPGRSSCCTRPRDITASRRRATSSGDRCQVSAMYPSTRCASSRVAAFAMAR